MTQEETIKVLIATIRELTEGTSDKRYLVYFLDDKRVAAVIYTYIYHFLSGKEEYPHRLDTAEAYLEVPVIRLYMLGPIPSIDRTIHSKKILKEIADKIGIDKYTLVIDTHAEPWEDREYILNPVLGVDDTGRQRYR